MNETAASAIEAETPVNPYTLLEAVNRDGRSAKLAWLIYLVLVAYVLITVAGVSHRDLLASRTIALPFLGTQFDLTRFFLLAPILIVFLHAGLMVQLALLARKTFEFAAALGMLEAGDRRNHPLRLELNGFFLLQTIAGAERSRIVSALLHGLGWSTLVLLPMLLLLHIQIAFLPYHDVTITWVHRIALLADIGLLVLAGVFLYGAEISFFRALFHAGRRHPLGLLLTGTALAGAAFFSLSVATIPGERLDRGDVLSLREHQQPGGPNALRGHLMPALAAHLPRRLVFFDRNLIVTDVDLRAPKDASAATLRGRDLRNATFDRSNFQGLDLSGSNLDGASFISAEMSGTSLRCIEGADRRCVSARNTDFSMARLSQADLSGIDLSQANLAGAHLELANLKNGLLSGTNLSEADIRRADLSGSSLQGANLSSAHLQGANLSTSGLQLADLANAGLQGANLAFAGLEGASLRDAALDGASMIGSTLFGADLAGAKLSGVDMSGAAVWRTVPPGRDNISLANLAQIRIRPPGDDQSGPLISARWGANDGAAGARLAEGLAQIDDANRNLAWEGSPGQQAWRDLAKSTEVPDPAGFKTRLTDYLGHLMCLSRWADGSVATGIVKRATAPNFGGEATAIYARLKSADCPGAVAIDPSLVRSLAAAVEPTAPGSP